MRREGDERSRADILFEDLIIPIIPRLRVLIDDSMVLHNANGDQNKKKGVRDVTVGKLALEVARDLALAKTADSITSAALRDLVKADRPTKPVDGDRPTKDFFDITREEAREAPPDDGHRHGLVAVNGHRDGADNLGT